MSQTKKPISPHAVAVALFASVAFLACSHGGAPNGDMLPGNEWADLRVVSLLEEQVELHTMSPEGMPPGVLEAREAAIDALGEDWGSRIEDFVALPLEAVPPQHREAHLEAVEAVRLMNSGDLQVLSADEERAELISLNKMDSGCWLVSGDGGDGADAESECEGGPQAVRDSCLAQRGEYDQHAHRGPTWSGMHAVCWS